MHTCLSQRSKDWTIILQLLFARFHTGNIILLLVANISSRRFYCSVLDENKRNLSFFSSTIFEDTFVRIVSLVGLVKKVFFDFAFRRPSLTRALWENIFPGWSGATIRRNGLRFIRYKLYKLKILFAFYFRRFFFRLHVEKQGNVIIQKYPDRELYKKNIVLYIYMYTLDFL